MITLLIAGCATHLRYEPVAFAIPPLTVDHPTLVGVVHDRIERGSIPSVAHRTPDGSTPLELATVGALSDTELYGLVAATGRKGAELDLLIDTERGSRPVTVWVALDGAMEVGSSTVPVAQPLPPSHVDERRWQEELAETYRLAGFRGPWTLGELGYVAMALEQLTPGEAEALAGVEVVRVGRSPRRIAEMAWYGPSEEPPRLEIYDAAFDRFGHGFVGPLDDPMPTPVMTILHEFGHAVVDRPLRETFESFREALEASARMVDPESFQAAYDRADDLDRCYRSLGRDGPVMDAYDAVRGRTRGPTTYGWRSRHHESFAEAFALHHLDPHALRRVMPAVADWFEREEHVTTGTSGGGCLRD